MVTLDAGHQSWIKYSRGGGGGGGGLGLGAGVAPRFFASGGKISYVYRALRARRISVGTIT